MIVQKKFSDIENPEETLYSVLMTEEEISLFSDKIENEANLGYAKGAALGGITGASLAAMNNIGSRFLKRNKVLKDAAKEYAGKLTSEQLKEVMKAAEKNTLPKIFEGKALAKSASKGALAGAAIGAGLVGLRKLQLKKRNKKKDNK